MEKWFVRSKSCAEESGESGTGGFWTADARGVGERLGRSSATRIEAVEGPSRTEWKAERRFS